MLTRRRFGVDIWALDEVSQARVSNLSSVCQLKTLFGVILVRVPGTGLLSIVIPLRSPEGLREEEDQPRA